MKKTIISLLLLFVLASCTGDSPQTTEPLPTPTVQQVTPSVTVDVCQPEPYTVPTLPASIPPYVALDKSIGLHVTGRHQVIDPETYRLKVSGKVNNPLELTYDQIRCLPEVTADPLLVCEGYFEDQATWTGVPLKTILEMADIQADAVTIVLVSADQYKIPLSLSEALEQESFLAYEVSGQTLPILHGFPLRAVVPGLNGDDWIKWLVEIEVKTSRKGKTVFFRLVPFLWETDEILLKKGKTTSSLDKINLLKNLIENESTY